MKNKTLKVIHESYIDSIPMSTNALEIVDSFHKKLLTLSDIANSDTLKFDEFVKAVYISKVMRQNTFILENMVTDFSFVIMYIIIYINSTKRLDIIMSFSGRIKSLESELSKLIETSVIYDRFGIMGILENSLSDKDATEFLRKIAYLVIGIVTRTNRKEYIAFLNWLRANPHIDTLSREKLEFILNLPFEEVKKSDYVTNPKPNGYRSMHYVLQVAMGNPLSGACAEVQFRTREMHEHATNGPSSHTEYEQNRRQMATKAFFITKKEFEKMKKIKPYLANYKDLDEFFDGGIHGSYTFLKRTISPSLVCL